MNAERHISQLPIQAIQHIRRMRGGSQSQLMRVSGGWFCVVKFMNNPQDVRVLANELFATRLAQKLGMPVPRPVVIEVSPSLIKKSQELYCESGKRRLPFKSGLCFGSSLIADLSKPGGVAGNLPGAAFEGIANLSDFANALVFDKWTCNTDFRQCVFTRVGQSLKYRATFIDQGHCFNGGEWSFPDAPLRGIYSDYGVYRIVTGWESFEPALSRAQGMDLDDIKLCAAGIPREWQGGVSNKLDRLIEVLHRRRAMIPDLISSFCRSKNCPFPNWKEVRRRSA